MMAGPILRSVNDNRRPFTHACAAIACATGLLTLQPSGAAEWAESGFGFCAKPAMPACMVDESTFRSPQSIHACDKDAEAFVLGLAAYRACLLKASQRAMSQGNDALSAYRCRSGQGSRC